MELILTIIIVVCLVGLMCSGYALYKIYKPSPQAEAEAEAEAEPPPWANERRTRDAASYTLEERIIETLSKGFSPREFFVVRMYSTNSTDEYDLFWEILKRLEAEGKVVRVADATETSDSLWALPTEEDVE